LKTAAATIAAAAAVGPTGVGSELANAGL
jgi:hypothetical protein